VGEDQRAAARELGRLFSAISSSTTRDRYVAARRRLHHAPALKQLADLPAGQAARAGRGIYARYPKSSHGSA
jgi:hypothetical protein